MRFLTDRVPALPTKPLYGEASSMLELLTEGYPETFVVEGTGTVVV